MEAVGENRIVHKRMAHNYGVMADSSYLMHSLWVFIQSLTTVSGSRLFGSVVTKSIRLITWRPGLVGWLILGLTAL